MTKDETPDLTKISDEDLFKETQRRNQVWVNWYGNLHMNIAKTLRIYKNRDLEGAKKDIIRAQTRVEMLESFVAELEAVLAHLPDPDKLKTDTEAEE